MRNTQLQQYAYAIACAIACKHVIKQTNSDWSILKGRYGDRGRQLHFANKYNKDNIYEKDNIFFIFFLFSILIDG